MDQNKLVLHVFETNEGYTYIAKSSSTIEDKIFLKEWTGYPTTGLENSVGEKRRFYGGVYKDIREVLFDFYIISEQEDKVLPETDIPGMDIKNKYWISGNYDKVNMEPLNYGEIKMGVLNFGSNRLSVTEVIPFPCNNNPNPSEKSRQ